jgi:PKD repeat protein
MLVSNQVDFDGLWGMYKTTASAQSFIAYDIHMAEAYDLSKMYTDIEIELYSEVMSITKEPFVVVSVFNPNVNKGRIRALSPPSITSISATNVTAGTSTVLTINGSNFGTTRGSGMVGFRDADFGDDRYYYSPSSWVYQVWSDTKIKVIVPARAGTGKIKIVNNSGNYIESTADLIVDWSHTNTTPTSASAPFYETLHRGINATRGYKLQLNSNFSANADATVSFIRALEEWRCETKINWTLGTDTDSSSMKRDSMNLVRFTRFDDSRLAAAYSRYSSCTISNSTVPLWYVVEVDLEFDSVANWHYGTGAPGISQYDFESAAAHELGHGHQLAHVDNDQQVMHYTKGKGERQPDLVALDIAAGNYVINKSTNTWGCSASMTELPLGSCVLRGPTSSFSIDTRVVCPNEPILFTNGTVGDVQGYEWIFGEDASIARSSLSGPHSVTYSTPGVKEVMLISYNFLGRDTATAAVVIREVPITEPEYIGADSACLGEFNMAVRSVADVVDYNWNVESGGMIVKDGINKITVRWDEPGLHKVTVGIQALCGLGPTNNIEVFVREPTAADFESETDGVTVKFYNRSTNSSIYLWTFGDGASSTEENPTRMYQEAREYQVSLTATGDCESNVFVRNIDLTSRLSVQGFTNSFTVFPNPLIIGEILTVSGEGFDTYLVYTMSGKMIEQGAVISNKINARIDSEGLYILVLQNTDGAVYHKLKVMD